MRWDNMQTLAKDVGISERTGWRWLQKGKITKEKDSDGHPIFVMEDPPPSPSPVTEAGPDNAGAAEPEQISEREFIQRPRPKPPKETRDVIRPTLIEPSPQMIKETEKTYISEMQERQALADVSVRKLQGAEVNPEVAAKEASVKCDELDVKGMRARLEFKKLKVEETEEEKKSARRNLIEKIKEECIPSWWRKELPPDLLLIALSTISTELSKYDLDTLSFEESVALGVLARNRVLCDPEHFTTANFARVRGVFKLVDAYSHQVYEQWKERSIQAICDIMEARHGYSPEMTRDILLKSGEYTFEAFTRWWMTELLRTDPQKLMELMKVNLEFLRVIGKKQEAEALVKRMDEILNRALRDVENLASA